MEEFRKEFLQMVEQFERDVQELGNPYGFATESIFRYYFYKAALSKEPQQEQPYLSGKGKADLLCNDCYIEFKFHRKLMNNTARPFPHDYGNLLGDFVKLYLKAGDRKKYVIYILDGDYIRYLEKHDSYGLLAENLVIITFPNPSFNTTIISAIGKDYEAMRDKSISVRKCAEGRAGGFDFYLFKIDDSAGSD